MKKLLFALLVTFFLITPALADTAYWSHSETAAVFKYRVAWGTTPGNYTFSQEMNRSDCVGGINPLGDTYDCKMPLTFTFVVGTTYYYTGYSVAYNSEGNEWLSDPVPEQSFTKRSEGNTTYTKPLPMREIGIYDK